jgi:hypothetical protein
VDGCFLKLCRQQFRAADIAFLSALVAAAKQNDDLCSASHEIEPISRHIVDPQLAHAFADRFDVAQQARLQTDNSLGDPPLGVGVSKPGKPILEDVGLPDFDNESLIDDNRNFVNYR